MSKDMTKAEQALDSIARSFHTHDPEAGWFLSITFALLAVIIAYYYIREKFILKRRFQARPKPRPRLPPPPTSPPMPPMRFRHKG